MIGICCFKFSMSTIPHAPRNPGPAGSQIEPIVQTNLTRPSSFVAHRSHKNKLDRDDIALLGFRSQRQYATTLEPLLCPASCRHRESKHCQVYTGRRHVLGLLPDYTNTLPQTDPPQYQCHRQTIGGMMLRLNPLTDPDLVGEDFPEEILAIPNLVYLDISGMKFGALPEEIDRLAALQTLVASRNDLEDLPKSLGNLTGLKKLFVNKNDLTGLPASLTQCTQLKTVDIKGNPIHPDTVGQLKQMFGEDVKVKHD